ncbi:TPA: hypothetical protein ACPYVZ_004542, partial [Citrobacter sedlakii]
MSVVTRDEKEAGNNISFTLADPGIGKKNKGSYDLDTPDAPKNKGNGSTGEKKTDFTPGKPPR